MPKATLFALLALSLPLAATNGYAETPTVEICNGTETVKIGDAKPMAASYKLTFEVDLSRRTFCYGSCTPEQTFPIANMSSSPMKLAELNNGSQIRRMTFDPASGRLTDYQVYNAGLGVMTRSATAICKAVKP